MRKFIIGACVLITLCAFVFPAADCSTLLFFKEGTSTTMTSYNDDGKITGTTKTVYTKVNKAGSSVSVSANQESFDKKGKSTSKSEYTIRCEKGLLLFDMKMMMPEKQAESYKDFEMTVEGADKEIPSEFVIGSKLKDADIKFKFKTKDGNEMPMMNMSFKITNRKVESKESITTTAGTYECYKITEDVEMKTLFAIKTKTATWFSPEVGTVKTEGYKDNGKFVSKTELTEIKK